MNLPPFLLDRWLAAHEFALPPIRFNLASSTGPAWTLAEILALGGETLGDTLAGLALSYTPPEGTRQLREQVARHHGVDPDWVLITTGAAEALSMLFCLVAEPGASVVVPAPAFPAIPVMADAWRLAVRRYTLDRDAGFAQTAEAVLDAVRGETRLALVNSPHNPTGSAMPRAELEFLAASLHDRQVPLVVDEVYHPLYFGSAQRSAAGMANTIVVGDFSKALSLSGLRLGWIVDGDAQRRERLLDLRSYFTISSSPVSEAIGAHALANSEAILTRLRDVASRNLASLDRFMDDHRDVLGWAPPQGGTVAFPWRRDGRDARPMCSALARAGVLVAPGDCFAMPEHFRLGIGAQVEGFREALDIAASVLADATY